MHWGLWLALAALLAQQPRYESTRPLTPETILLARVRYVMAQRLRQLPNYTCTQTIERSRRLSGSKRFELVDTVRLEVALVGGKELYAWPGSSRFEEREISEMVSGGAIGSGDFGAHARSIYLGSTASFTYRGREPLDGRELERFDFKVLRTHSTYLMRIRPLEALVGYSGTLWHDPHTLEAVRLDIEVDDIPDTLPLRSAGNRIEYQVVEVGETDFLLPKTAQIEMVDLEGNLSRNRTVFTDCRQFSGESTLRFDDPGPDTTPAEAPVTLALPPGLELRLRLAGDVAAAQAAVGDEFSLELTREARKDGKVWLRKGAKVFGRIALSQRFEAPVSGVALGLRLVRFSDGNRTGDVVAALEFPEPYSFVGAPVPLGGGGSSWARRAAALPRVLLPAGSSLLYVSGRPPRLGSGYPMTWRTLEVRGETPQ